MICIFYHHHCNDYIYSRVPNESRGVVDKDMAPIIIGQERMATLLLGMLVSCWQPLEFREVESNYDMRDDTEIIGEVTIKLKTLNKKNLVQIILCRKPRVRQIDK